METRTRSLIKAICWQMLGLVTMSGVGVMMTGSLAMGGMLAAMNAAVGFVAYLAYERVWANVRWGRRP